MTRLSVLGDPRDERRTLEAAPKCRSPIAESVARFSLLLVTMTCTSGCFDAPPEYSEPTRVPPVISAVDCVPPLTSLFISTGDTAEFTVAFRADDFGVSLRARFVRDISIGDAVFIDQIPVPPDARAFADQDVRSAVYPWHWNQDGQATLAGCHSVTAIISDASNFDGKFGTTDSRQEARTTWFVWLQDLAAPPNDGVSCPAQTTSGVKP